MTDSNKATDNTPEFTGRPPRLLRQSIKLLRQIIDNEQMVDFLDNEPQANFAELNELIAECRDTLTEMEKVARCEMEYSAKCHRESLTEIRRALRERYKREL